MQRRIKELFLGFGWEWVASCQLALRKLTNVSENRGPDTIAWWALQTDKLHSTPPTASHVWLPWTGESGSGPRLPDSLTAPVWICWDWSLAKEKHPHEIWGRKWDRGYVSAFSIARHSCGGVCFNLSFQTHGNPKTWKYPERDKQGLS